jgi:hypothetical protein
MTRASAARLVRSAHDREATAVMSDITEVKQKKGSVVAGVAGVSLALLGASTAGERMSGGSLPHADHGHSPARWTGAAISLVGFLIGGIGFPFHLWALVGVGGALQIVALISVVILNAAGYGRPDVWGALKAEAAAKRLAQ